MPEELQATRSPAMVLETEDEVEKFNQADLLGGKAITADQSAHLIETYGANNWYDWQRLHWGVKWGDCRTQLERNGEKTTVITFSIPWGTAENAFCEISKKWPKLRFHVNYFERGMGFKGTLDIKNGVAEGRESEYSGRRGG